MVTVSDQTSAMSNAEHEDGMPVTIITGFLGSGKTTLLNHILANQQGLKTAVLVNEFGEIGIDNDLIVSSDEDNTMIELSNGCVCCTINEDLVNAVHKILERKSKIDYLVVETTGLADPLPVALTFLGTELRDMTRLDSIVTTVDCANFSLDLFNSEAAYSQIAYGDIILLNKTDLVPDTDVDSLEVRIREIKEGSRILRTQNSEVPLPLLLSVGLFESDKYYEEADQHAEHNHDHSHHDHGHEHNHSHHDHDHDHDHNHEEHDCTPECDHEDHNHDHAHNHAHHDHDHSHSHEDHDHQHHDHNHEHNHAHHDHDHSHHDHKHHDHSHHLENDGFSSISVSSDQPFNIRKFQYFLDNQLPVNVFRAKGILWFEESPLRHIFHLSGKRFTIDDSEWKRNEVRQNKIVLIGQDIDKETLREQIENCIVVPDSDD